MFDAIAHHALDLLGSGRALVLRHSDGLLHLVAHQNLAPERAALAGRRFPQAPAPHVRDGEVAVLDGTVVHVPDLKATTEFPDADPPTGAACSPCRSCKAARPSESSASAVERRSRFTSEAIPLLQTFADQAVIAIENARLFEELGARNAALTESLEQQTATAEILRVIGTSPMDAQPVFDGIARSGVAVCGAKSCTLFVVDGDMVRVAATHGVPTERVERFRTQFPMPLDAESDTTGVIRERGMVHLADIEHNPAATAEHVELARLGGYRTRLMVPMMRGDSALGVIAVTRESPGAFPDRQIDLLKTFADQAVIAIENMRLFREIERRNAELKSALERETATADVLRIIAQSPTELQPVLDAIAASAVRLCEASDAVIERLEGDRFYNAAHAGSQMKGLIGLPLPLSRDFPAAAPSWTGGASSSTTRSSWRRASSRTRSSS